MDTELILRQLARSNYWQQVYSASKENGIELFENKKHLSALQSRFLYWLAIYETLYTELATKEDKYLSEAVIEDDVRCDAYLIYRHKKHEALWEKYRKDEVERDIKNRHPKRHKTGHMNVMDFEMRSQ